MNNNIVKVLEAIGSHIDDLENTIALKNYDIRDYKAKIEALEQELEEIKKAGLQPDPEPISSISTPNYTTTEAAGQ